MAKGEVFMDEKGIAERMRAAANRLSPDPARPFDEMIGRLDRVLSEFLIEAARAELDEADRQTIKHHADDLIGVGQKALRLTKGEST